MSRYQEVFGRIVAHGKPALSKRVANHTYAELRIHRAGAVTAPETVQEWDELPTAQQAVAIRFHKTDVVLYHSDGTIVLSSGGWHTNSTRARINDWLPRRVFLNNHRGEWWVAVGADRWADADNDSRLFVDGITLAPYGEDLFVGGTYLFVAGTFPSPERVVELRAAKKKLEKDVRGFLAKVPEKLAQWGATIRETGTLPTSADCFYCQGIVTNMDGGKDTGVDHLWAHLREGYLFPSLFILAYQAKSIPPEHFLRHAAYGFHERPVKVLREYLLEKLSASSEPSSDIIDRTHLEWALGQAEDVLEKPSDFGYFGGDDALWNTSAPTWTRTRDSDSRERANFELVWETLKREFPELVPTCTACQGSGYESQAADEDGTQCSSCKGTASELDAEGYPSRSYNGGPAIYLFGSGHWAVGHIDQIVVPVKLDGTRPVDVDNLHPAFLRLCDFGRQVRDYPLLDGAEEIAERIDHEDHLSEAKQYVEGDVTDEQLEQIVAEVKGESDGEFYLEPADWYRIVAGLELTPVSWLARYAPADADA